MSKHEAPSKPFIELHELLHADYALFVVTTVVVLARVAIHVVKRKTMELQDYFIYFAYALYLTLWTAYVKAAPVLFKLSQVKNEEIPVYKTVLDDGGFVAKMICVAQLCYYTHLFAVKWSLLALYRKLLVGLHKIYNQVWWLIFIFCVLAWIGCIVSTISSCKDYGLFLRTGQCSSPAELKIQVISLYYAYAVDVLTDFMVMFLPIRLTWNLQMPRSQKIGIFVLFGSGFICILFATLRTVEIGVVKGQVISPEPIWMSLWTVVETSTATIIGCAPAFASVIRARINSQKPSYNSQGYIKHSGDNIKLKSKISSPSRTLGTDTDTMWDDGHASQEELAKNRGRIMVTTTVHQDDERSSNISRV